MKKEIKKIYFEKSTVSKSTFSKSTFSKSTFSKSTFSLAFLNKKDAKLLIFPVYK